MTDYGVTATGFVKKTLVVIRQEIQDELRDAISTELDLLDSSVLGQIEGVFSDKLREMWDVAEAVYRAMYPDSASDEALDQVSSITGAVRLPATKSKVTLRLWLNAGVTVTVGSIVSVGSTGSRFVIIEAVSNPPGSAIATFSTTAESEDYGPIAGYAESIDTIQTAIAGWSAAAAVSGTIVEPFSLDGLEMNLVVDEDGSTQNIAFAAGDPWTAADAATEINTSTTGITAYDDGNGMLRIASSTEGPGSAIEILAGTANAPLGLTVALHKGMNADDADPGSNIETDPALRLRRDSALRSSGSATVEAIYAALVLIDDVEQVVVVENTEDHPVGDLPGKSFEAIVLGGTKADVAVTLWREKPAGIKTYGTTTETITDSMGFDHDICFSRPTEVRLYVNYELTVDADLYPANGNDQVKAAVVAHAQTLGVGVDVIALQFKAIPLDIAGVIDVIDFDIDIIDPPVGIVNIPITTRQLAALDTTDITVT